MKKIEILVVEDEPKLAQTISDFLRIQNYEVETALTGNKALEYFCQNKQKVDLILLDLMLPDISGYTVLKEIRKISEVPVIILSARSAVADQMILCSGRRPHPRHGWRADRGIRNPRRTSRLKRHLQRSQ